MIIAHLCVGKSKKHYNPRYIQEQRVSIYTLIFENGF